MRKTFATVRQERARVFLTACLCGFLASTIAQPLPDPAPELRRQQERSQAQQQQIQGPRRDVALDAPAAATPATQRLPINESPCFAITQVEVREATQGSTPTAFNWLGVKFQ